MSAQPPPIDLKELKTWLEERPRSWSVALATRCALRALPALNQLEDLEGQDSETVLTTFRQVSAAYAYVLSEERSGSLWAPTSDNTTADIGNFAVAIAFLASDAAFAIPRTAHGSTDPRFVESLKRGGLVLAVDAALKAVAHLSDFADPEIRQDVTELQSGLAASRLVQMPLWAEGRFPDDFYKDWEGLKSRLPGAGEGWEVWIRWYEDRLAGTPPIDVSLEVARASLPQPIWSEGPAEVDAHIAEFARLFEQGGSAEVLNELAKLRSFDETTQSANPDAKQAVHLEIDDNSAAPSTTQTPHTSLPSVWLLQYNRNDWTPSPEETSPGSLIRWKTGKSLPRDLKAGDPVIYWQTTRQGGIAGTGHVISTDAKLEDGVLRLPTEVHEFEDDNLIPRLEAINEAGIDRKNWQGAILRLPEAQAKRLNGLLLDKDRSPIFSDTVLNQSTGEPETDEGRRTENIAGPASGSGTDDALIEAETSFAPDDAETERDDLGRGILAIALARRLHLIWCRLNNALWHQPKKSEEEAFDPVEPIYEAKYWTGEGAAELRGDHEVQNGRVGKWFSFDRSRQHTRAGFVLHLDAPWGGGKTTFANFLARVLNPTGYHHGETSFLTKRYGGSDLSTVFLSDPLPKDGSGTGDGRNWPEDACRPWIVVPFNAWQAQHVKPPWWVFYQSIRKRCFDSIAYEGWEPEEINGVPKSKPGFWHRQYLKLRLWAPEMWWRLTSPKVVTLILTGALSLGLFWLLYHFGVIELNTNAKGQSVLGFSLGSDKGFGIADGVGLMLTALTGLSFLWGAGALLTESIRPGTDTLAERLSLGNGDPFERFRRHFYKTMERVKRPVLVIVDDLDRCSPDFIVDLVRGMQTLLRSPRVVFVVLGDRDWIERAFEVHHKDMNKVSVGPEQTFGARFVEKAIQMSFILPGLMPERQKDYVRRLLLGAKADKQSKAAKPISTAATQNLRVFFQRAVQQPAAPVLDSEALKEQVRSEATAASASSEDMREVAAVLTDEDAFESWFKDEYTIHAASDEDVEAEISHRLEPLADNLPANPRQIKRIINGVTMYNAVAFRQRDWKPDNARWLQLARWIVIMTEWPKTWRLLASYPSLTDLLYAQDQSDAFDTMTKDAARSAELPESKEATLSEIERIKGDVKLLALISGDDGHAGEKLDRDAIADLATLTPLHSRAAEPEEKKKKDAKS